MIIIAGKCKGRRIFWDKSENLRPTKARVREAIFNIIAPVLEGSRFLDLYSGIGSIGLEAVSRGARDVTFCDSDGHALDILRSNIDHLRLKDQCTLFQSEACQGLKELHRQGQLYDIIYMDAPYLGAETKNALNALLAYDTLTDYGIVICEHHRREEMPQEVGVLILIDQRKYGTTKVSFYRKNQI